ncbi:MAG: ABC transporter permease [Rhodospirillales bacterium]|nr:ABC transporter permease [Rhodospirillales bacterium]
MIRVIASRVASAVPILILVSLITFGMIHMIPGGPAAAIAGLSATPQQIAEINHNLGLDKPLPVQLYRWYDQVLHGNLGTSLLLGQPVSQAIMIRLPVTFGLSLYALVITLAIGLSSGILAALRQNTWVDQVAMIFSIIGISLPNFYLALLMIIFFAVDLGWLPSGGYVPFFDDPLGWLGAMTLPAISLALLLTGLLARITRSTMLEVLRQDYIRTARAKGLPQRQVVLKHALANAMIPIVTVIGIIVSLLLSGAVVTETIFSLPGIGQLLTEAVLNRDYPMVQGGVLVVTALMVGVNILVDVLYAALDPRVRYHAS